MTAYMVLTHTVADVDRFVGEYVSQVRPLLQKHGIEVIAAGFGMTPLEGSANSAVVFRSASEEAFHRFYDDPEFDGPKALRHSISLNSDMLIVPAFTPPA